MNKHNFDLQKFQHDFEEDMRHMSEQNLKDALKFAVKEGHLSEEQAEELLKNKEAGFYWLFKGEG